MKRYDHSHQEGGAPTIELVIDSKRYSWNQQYITGRQIRELGKIPDDCDLFLKVPEPWKDERIKDDRRVDLAVTEPKPEHFYHRKKHEKVLIFIDDKRYEVERGIYIVTQLKDIGKVPQAYELKELIDGRLVPLDDNAQVTIKGCEVFFGTPRSGKSS